MANTLKDVKAKVRQLCSDFDGAWLDDETLVPLINQIYEQQVSYLAGTCSPYITKLAVVPNVQPGTTSLANQQQNGPVQQLQGLIKPRYLDSKLAGTPDVNYCRMKEFDVLPNVGAGYPVVKGGWEWRSFILWLLPLPNAVDIRVRGDFMPPPLIKDTDFLVVHPNMAHATAYGTAALAAATVGNQGWITNYGAQATLTLDDISAQLVRQQGAVTFRLGRMNSGRGSRRGSNGN